MRTAVVNHVLAILLVAAIVRSSQAAGKAVWPETSKARLASLSGKPDHWQSNPPLLERRMLPKEPMPLGHRTRLGEIAAAAPAVQPKIDGSCAHKRRLRVAVSAAVPSRPLLSLLCILIV